MGLMKIEERPEKEEVLKEFERLSSSKTFLKQSTLVEFLRVLVKSALNRKNPTEHELGVKVFGKPDAWRPDREAVVRENTRRLRRFLKAYYQEEGLDDLVVIDLNGRGRKPRFSYNSKRHAVAELRRIVEEWDRLFPQMLSRFSGRIVAMLEHLIEENPSYSPAYTTLAEVLITYTMCDDPIGFPVAISIRKAQEAIDKSLTLNDKFWKSHLIAGALYCCRFEWAKAEKAFQRASNLDSERTRRHFWYRSYLLALGKIQEESSCEYLAERTRSKSDELYLNAIHALKLYIMRDFNQARWHLVFGAMSWDWIPDIRAYQMGADLIADSWLVNVLMACICLGETGPGGGLHYGARGSWESHVEAFYGIEVLCLMNLKASWEHCKEQAERALKWVKKREGQREMHGSVSLALSYVGLERMDDAIGQLRKACEDGNPLMVFLHLWPIFDPLREHAGFKALISDMRLPASVETWATDLRLHSYELIESQRQRKEYDRQQRQEELDLD